MTESLSMSHLQLDQEICLDKINMALYLSPELRRPSHVTKLLKGTVKVIKVQKYSKATNYVVYNLQTLPEAKI